MPDEQARLATAEKSIANLEKESAVTSVRLEQICKEIGEIKSNHLVHINDELTAIHTTIAENQTALLEQVTNLRLYDAKAEPAHNIINEVVKYAILALVGAVIGVVLSHTI